MASFKPIPESGEPASCIGSCGGCSAAGLLSLTLLGTALFKIAQAVKKDK
jgi:hypothetical protein